MKDPARACGRVSRACGFLVSAALLVGPASGPARAQEAAVVPADQAAVLEAADADRSKGADDAPIRIVEVSDFECPFCADFYRSTYPAIDSLYVDSGIARYLWISFPNSRHRRAWPAIEAAFCAGAAGRFWPMHDILFETREAWSGAEDPRALFVEYAVRAGVEASSFEACLANDQPAPLQVSDYESALRSGITSTPFFIVGDSLAIRGALPLDRFRAAVDSVLEARGLPVP
jgi:protein-disulfide isomerase